MKRLLKKAIRSFGYEIAQQEDIESLELHLLQIFRSLNVNCVIDVGAHYGEFGRFLRSIGFDGHIVSVEPVQANYDILQQKIAGDSKWEAHRLALGSQSTEMTMNVTSRSEMSSFLNLDGYAKERFGEASEVAKQEKVKVRPLDEIYGELSARISNPRVFLKLDTQGYDFEVLAGAKNSLPKVLALLSEVSVKPLYQGMVPLPESLTRLAALGFELTGMFPVTRDHDGLRIIEFDCVLLRSGKS